MPIFMKVFSSHGDSLLRGSERKDFYKGWIELNSVTQTVARATGRVGGRMRDKEGTLRIARPRDGSMTGLARLASKRIGGMRAKIHFVQDGTSNTYLKYELENVLISNYSTHGGSASSERVDLDYKSGSA